MKRLLKKLLAEWEKSIFWIFLISLVAMLSMQLLGILREPDGGTEPPDPPPPRQSLLGPKALAFLTPLESATLEGGNPFTFIRRLHEFSDKVKRPWQQPKTPTFKKPTTPDSPKNPVASAVAGPVKPKEPVLKPAATASATKPGPPKNTEPPTASEPAGPPPTRIVHYKGLHIGPSGTAMAYVSSKDPNTKKTSSGFRKVGADAGGIVVKSFDEAALHVGIPGQERIETIPIGGQKKIILE